MKRFNDGRIRNHCIRVFVACWQESAIMQMPVSQGEEHGSPHVFPAARIGHVNLKVADLERSLAFYSGMLGLKITKRIGNEAAFLAFGSYHHDICVNTWQSRDGSAPPRGTTGLFHVAIVYSRRAELRDTFLRLQAEGIAIDSLIDHGVSQSLYLRDPDQNGIELYWDRPSEHWWADAGELKMGHRIMTLDEFLQPDTVEAA